MKKGFLTKLLFLIVLFSVGAALNGQAQVEQEKWQLLAQRKVNFVRDKDEIVPTSTAVYTALRFAAADRSIGISEVKIYFVNGDKLEPQLDEIIKKGERSRVIEFGTEGRQIKKIEFKYRTIGSVFKGRANLLVYGRLPATP